MWYTNKGDNMRLDKFIAECLKVSRKDAKTIIKKKLVKINNEIIKNDSYNVQLDTDIVTYQNDVLKYEQYIYLLMHKPSGYVSARVDNLNKTVMMLVPNEYLVKDLTIVGRLDIDTEGVLLLTNDGSLVHNLTSPNHNVSKTYYVEFDGVLKENAKALVESGIEIEDYITKPGLLNVISSNQAEITISEGKFHQVKKMFEKLNTKVTYLKRIKFDTITLDNLELGNVRKLTEEEIEILKGK